MGPKAGGTGLAQGLGTFANSSRTPNCKLHDIVSAAGIWLVAIRAIRKGEEITHKYSLCGAQTPKKFAQESTPNVNPMQLQNRAYKVYEECHLELSARYIDQYEAPSTRKQFEVLLMPESVDERLVKEFTAAHSVTVTALGRWQNTNGNTDSANVMPDVDIAGGGEVYEHYTSVRCDMGPELDKVDMAPWFGDLMFGKRSKFDWSTGATNTRQKPVVVGMALACHTEGTQIGEMDLPDNGRNNEGGRCEVEYSSTVVLEIEVRDNHSFHHSAKFPQKDVEGKMVVLMDFFTGQVMQWNTMVI